MSVRTITKGAARARYGVKVADKELKRLRGLVNAIATKGVYVKAGLLAGKSGKPRKSGRKTLTNVQLGIIHEFGTRDLPARPFIRPAFQKNRAVYLLMLRDFFSKQVIPGKWEPEKAYGIVGAKMAADMKLYVTAGPQIPPPNKLATIRRKLAMANRTRTKQALQRKLLKQNTGEAPASPRTLVDTGRMVGSITWSVESGGAGKSKR